MSEHHQFIFPRDFHLAPPDWPALQARLLEGGYVLPAQGDSIPYSASRDSFDEADAAWHSVQYCLGPAARPYLSAAVRDDYDADPRNFPILLLAFDGENPRVMVGENLCAPSRPGSNEPASPMPADSHVDFIGQAYENPAAQWHCEQSGRSYRILELDWHYSLAMGFRMVRCEGLDRESAQGLARLIGELTGQVMGCSHRHL
ncbi:hypothetical protein DBL07_00620 [Achromobacter mucicolens]|uniref:hypothetical protein n=1 Tax=Achromobacter mucicolens TaxID=1389922 RepID=UPI000D39AEC3|nr:hypothetical protein [Achromobacter mucicolens]PTX13249.1 hypothetical protein DBL07_00620 [Achromobacter mucicolens]